MISEPETREEPPNRDLATIREAQRVVGELVWVATRTRPDLAFTITKLASLVTKDPQQVLDLTKHVWCYLAATADHGLQFCNAPDEKQLNIYTDASFGTETSMGLSPGHVGHCDAALEIGKASCGHCFNGGSRIGRGA